jgi:orotate phosphoribosyltransferase-like protein
MSLDISAEFPGEELKKSLDNIQSVLDASKPLAEQLVSDQKVKNAIAKCIEALQAVLSHAKNEDEEWAKRKEKIGWKQITESEQRQKRIKYLLNKKKERCLTQNEQTELADLEQEEGMR